MEISRSKMSFTYFQGTWSEGSTLTLGARSHAVWMSAVVFDGARAINGKIPDLDRHCARLIVSAEAMGLAPTLSACEIEALIREGVSKFPKESDIYICPIFYGGRGFIVTEPDSTQFELTLSESALPKPTGFSASLASFRRPAPDMAPTNAKASCLYPNVARCLREAESKGYDTAVVLDPIGNVAEFAVANLFMVKAGVVHTPALNGCFLNGITRQRVMQLLMDAGQEIIERTITFDEVLEADELFGTGNYYKVAPCIRLEDKAFKAGPVYQKARQLYFEFAANS